MSIGEQTTFTAADLLETPDGDSYELVHGRLVERSAGMEASWIAGSVLVQIGAFVERRALGWTVGWGAGYQYLPDEPDHVRRASVSFVARGRLPDERLPRGHCRIAPDLAVEVVSPNDSYYEVDQKVREYLAAGVKLVWVVNPDSRSLLVHRRGGAPSDLAEHDIVSGEDVLPGFECRVAEFFPPRG